MKVYRGVLLLVGLLFVLRVAACDGGPSGTSGPATPSGDCFDGMITYTVKTLSGSDTRQHQCTSPNQCTVDAATGSARCDQWSPNAPPFWTCHTAADCAGAKICKTLGNSAVTLLGSPTCVEGVCDWQAQTDQPCAGGQVCFASACGSPPNSAGIAGTNGSTSGGFPWMTGTAGSTGGP
jgi:hypothetical protein